MSKTADKREALRAFNVHYSLRSVFENLCAGGTLAFVSFAFSIGVPRERIGLITSVASAACILQMLTLFLANHIRQRKRFVIALSILEPILMIVVILSIPWLPPPARFPALIAGVFLAAATLHLTKPFTDGWMAALIPAGIRGRYIGRRIQWMTISTIASTLTVGLLLQYGIGASSVRIAMLLSVGALFGLLAALRLRPVDMPVLAATSQVSLGDVWAVISGRHRPFYRYLLGMMVYLIPFYLAIPFYQVFYLRILQMPEAVIALMHCGYFLVKIPLMRPCGRMVDRFGSRAMLLLAGALYTVFYAIFPLNETGRFWPLLIAWGIAAPADGLYGVAITSTLYGSIPNTSNRSVFFAVSNLVALGGYAFGALLAMPILARLQPLQIAWGPFLFSQYQAFFALCALLMACCTFSSYWIAPAKRATGAYGRNP